MSTTSGLGEPECGPDDVVSGTKQHKRLAPKTAATVAMSLEESTGSGLGQQTQQPDQPASPQFEFINTTTKNQYSGRGSRSAARSHVMRNFHRKKGKPKQQPAHLSEPSLSQSLSDSPHVVHGPLYTSKEWPRLIGVRSPGLQGPDENAMKGLALWDRESGSHDRSALWLPFPQPRRQGPGYERDRERERPDLRMNNLWALPVDAHATELIYHYVQVFAKAFLPMSQTWESEWFKNALSDPACFHGTLFLSVAHKALLAGTDNPLPLECFQHKGKAIRIINERISDPEKRVTDGTIATIACLAVFETLSGTTSDANVHIDGLQKLVGMRGGLKQLGMNGLLEQFLYWVDLSNATATREKPHFVPLEMLSEGSMGSDSESIWKYCNSQWNEDLLVDLPMKPCQGLDTVEAGLLHRLRQLIVLAASNPSTTGGPAQQAYTKLVLILERQISVAVQERLAFKIKFDLINFSPSTCVFYIPALIICYMILRPTPVRSSIYGPMVTRMKLNVEQLAKRQLFERFPMELWFWALLFVGAASLGRPEQAYFQLLLTQLCNILDIHSWERAKIVVAEFVWADQICERPCKAFWDTLEGVEGSRIEEDVVVMGHAY